MKLLVIEGADRCGKNTLIKNLVSQTENYVVRHFGSAKGNTDFQKRDSQFNFFKKEFELASKRPQFHYDDLKNQKDIWIWNRSHLGEYIYGSMYRNTSPQEWIPNIERLYGFDIDTSVYLLLLTADAEFLCKHDDGLSFTANVHKKQKELSLFREAFDQSQIINKKIINVSNGEDYLDSDIILNEVNKFLFNELY